MNNKCFRKRLKQTFTLLETNQIESKKSALLYKRTKHIRLKKAMKT